MSVRSLPKAITKEVLLNAIQNKLMSCTKMFWDPNTTVQQMYEDLTCSVFSGDPESDFPDEVKEDTTPVLDEDFCFEYKGYQFELSSCTVLTYKEQLFDITNENLTKKFPHGIFTDRYVCWMLGHKDIEGETKEEARDPDTWCPNTYLVSGAWSWGAKFDLEAGRKVNELILSEIDKFLETFKE